MSQDPATAAGDALRRLVYYTVPPIIKSIPDEGWCSWLLFPGALLMAAGCKKLPPLGNVSHKLAHFALPTT